MLKVKYTQDLTWRQLFAHLVEHFATGTVAQRRARPGGEGGDFLVCGYLYC